MDARQDDILAETAGPTAPEAFFRRSEDHYLPNPVAAGPWRAQSLIGRIVVGLLAHEIEARHFLPGFIPARLTVDLYRLPDFSPIQIVTRVLRDGGRIKLIEAEFLSGGVSAARACCQLLKRTAQPPGTVWTPPDWDAPPPSDALPHFEPKDKWRWSVLSIEGGFGALGPKKAWLRDYRALVACAPLTPFVRAAQAADFVSPWCHASDAGQRYINSDVTLYLQRLPVGEWIGLHVTDHQATYGVAVGNCSFYDEEGPIGFGAAAALAQERPKKSAP